MAKRYLTKKEIWDLLPPKKESVGTQYQQGKAVGWNTLRGNLIKKLNQAFHGK